MTVNEKKDYLNRYRIQLAKISRLKEMLNTYPDSKPHCQPQLDKAEYIRDKIEAEIEAIGDELLSEVLMQKYMCGRSLSEIAERMVYSSRHIERLHARALERFEVFSE